MAVVMLEEEEEEEDSRGAEVWVMSASCLNPIFPPLMIFVVSSLVFQQRPCVDGGGLLQMRRKRRSCISDPLRFGDVERIRV
jgi:hypothetical protein